MADSPRERNEVLRAAVEAMLALERKAKGLESTIPPAKLFFGLIGVDLDFENFDVIPNYLRIRRVTNAPGVVHIVSASDTQHSDWTGVSRYSPLISAETAIGDEGDDDLNTGDLLNNLAWHTVALLKLRGCWMLRCPASSTVSWDVVAAYRDRSVLFTLLDDVPKSVQVLGENHRLATSDAEWVAEHFNRSLELRNHSTSQRFGLAFSLAYTCNHAADLRIVMANIWCALDALFGKNERKLSVRLCERIAAFLPQITYPEIRQLYDLRCDAVHGRPLESSLLSAGLHESYALLRGTLIRAIETGTTTLTDWH